MASRWAGFGEQTFFAVAVMAMTFGLLLTLIDLVAPGQLPNPAGVVFSILLYTALGLMQGWATAIVATVALRAWRNVEPTPPLRIAAWLSLALAAPWAAALAVGAPAHASPFPGSIFLPAVDFSSLLPFHVAAGALFGAFAWAMTRRQGPTLACVAAGGLASMSLGRLLGLPASDSHSYLWVEAAFVTTFCACCFAGAWAYTWVKAPQSSSGVEVAA